LRERFQAVTRQPQSEAISEIARTGIAAYLKAHRGEGTCRSISASEQLVKDGVAEMASRYQAQGWKASSQEWSSFAVFAKGSLSMGFGFFLYASERPGCTDCEILYAIGAPVEDDYRAQMEVSLHQGLPWTVQAEAARQGAARTMAEGA
jgi:hypothetical protein